MTSRKRLLASPALLLSLLGVLGGCSSAPDVGASGGAALVASTPATSATDTLDANRARLFQSYFDYLQGVTTPQTNGLSSASGTDDCQDWALLDPSTQSVFDTLTVRLQGSKLADGSSMLSHVTRIYRMAGGQGATATNPGSCGGDEYNRMIMSMDAALHDALVDANDDQGAEVNGVYDIADLKSGSYWRNSHDLGGPHSPFDLSDETNAGAPRGQVQYFREVLSTVANQPLGRQDLTTLVDPYALEMDEDYNCPHDSNPLCSYVTYGDLCFPETEKTGLQIFTASYGDPQTSWTPTCAGGGG